jgi:hypothetical protein
MVHKVPALMSALAALSALVTACGGSEPQAPLAGADDHGSAPGGASLPMTVASTSVTSSVVAVTDSPDVTTGSTSEGQTIGMSIEFGQTVIEIEIPADAVADPLASSMPNPPRSVIAVERWFLEGCCRFGVVVQTDQPALPEDALLFSFLASGMEWGVYDGGPMNGTELVAVARLETFAISVAAQSASTDDSSMAATAATVKSVAESTRVTAAVEDDR